MSTDLVPIQTEVLAPADLSSADAVGEYLARLLPATRGTGQGTLAGALVPWLCDAVPSENGRKAYATDLRQFLAHLERCGISPTEVTGDDIRLYKEAMRKGGLASSTIARKLSLLRGTYEQWGKKGFVDWHTVQDIQAAESPRVEKNSTPGLTQAEASKLLHAPDLSTLQGKRDHALLFVFFRTSCRVSAVANANVGHIERDDTDWFLRVTEKGNKRSRKILLEAVPALRDYIEAAGIENDREGPLFRPLHRNKREFVRRHLDRRDVWALVKKYGRQVGIDVDRIDSRGVGVHSLRKTTITNALNNGAPMHQVQELAGHADIRTTQGYYMRKDSDAEAAARHIQIR